MLKSYVTWDSTEETEFTNIGRGSERGTGTGREDRVDSSSDDDDDDYYNHKGKGKGKGSSSVNGINDSQDDDGASSEDDVFSNRGLSRKDRRRAQRGRKPQQGATKQSQDDVVLETAISSIFPSWKDSVQKNLVKATLNSVLSAIPADSRAQYDDKRVRAYWNSHKYKEQKAAGKRRVGNHKNLHEAIEAVRPGWKTIATQDLDGHAADIASILTADGCAGIDEATLLSVFQRLRVSPPGAVKKKRGKDDKKRKESDSVKQKRETTQEALEARAEKEKARAEYEVQNRPRQVEMIDEVASLQEEYATMMGELEAGITYFNAQSTEETRASEIMTRLAAIIMAIDAIRGKELVDGAENTRYAIIIRCQELATQVALASRFCTSSFGRDYSDSLEVVPYTQLHKPPLEAALFHAHETPLPGADAENQKENRAARNTCWQSLAEKNKSLRERTSTFKKGIINSVKAQRETHKMYLESTNIRQGTDPATPSPDYILTEEEEKEEEESREQIAGLLDRLVELKQGQTNRRLARFPGQRQHATSILLNVSPRDYVDVLQVSSNPDYARDEGIERLVLASCVQNFGRGNENKRKYERITLDDNSCIDNLSDRVTRFRGRDLQPGHEPCEEELPTAMEMDDSVEEAEGVGINYGDRPLFNTRAQSTGAAAALAASAAELAAFNASFDFYRGDGTAPA